MKKHIIFMKTVEFFSHISSYYFSINRQFIIYTRVYIHILRFYLTKNE